MKLTLQHLHVPSTSELDAVVEERVLELEKRVRIDEAIVRLERWREQSPAFRVWMHIVTPGPDIFAEARDYTIRAAFDKALEDLNAKIDTRALKRTQRIKSNLQARSDLRPRSR